MRDATLYDRWEQPSRAEVNGRSYLAHLEPMRVGTAAVESLTSYVSRLAAMHAVEAGVLISRELLPRIPLMKGASAGECPAKIPEYSFDAHALNGSGDRSRLWVALIERLTCIQRLDLLTALPWARAISCVHLLRRHRAWCSCCYEDGPSSVEPPYERLLWAFQLVTVCPTHGRRLDTECPSCGREQRALSAKHRPGYCSRCQCWLGRNGAPDATNEGVTEHIRVAEMVGELLVQSSSLPADFGTELFRANVASASVSGLLPLRGGNRRRDVRDWVHRAAVPRMDSLVALSRTLKVPLIRLLTERIDTTGNRADQRYSPKAHHRVAGVVVEEALRGALTSPVPPSLLEVASRLGYRTAASLQCRHPLLCNDIVSRKRAWTEASGSASGKPPVPRATVERALADELKKEGVTSLKDVAAALGVNKRRLYKGFHEIRRAIMAKNKAIRSQNADAIARALQTVVDEQPVPTVTEMARRLGFRCVSGVTSRFPELAAELRRKRRDALTEPCGRKNDYVRQKLTEALLELPPPPCAKIVRRLRGHKTTIREGFPDLWRALRARYVTYKRDVLRTNREAIESEVLRAVVELRRKGVNVTYRLVLASIPESQRRFPSLVEDAVRAVRCELSSKL
jgi:TniQ